MKKNSLFWRLVIPLALASALLHLLLYSFAFLFTDNSGLSFALSVAAAGTVALLATLYLGLKRTQHISGDIAKIQSEIFPRKQSGFSRRISHSELQELNELWGAVNKLLAENEEQHRNLLGLILEREAILGTMSEGLIAIDLNERILGVNEAAAKMFRIDEKEAKSRSLQEVVRSRQLMSLLDTVFETKIPQETEIQLPTGDEERVYQVRASIVSDESRQNIMALLFFHDLSHLRKLENVRRDFVANVSHELRTPITSIKGFVETLLEGALESPEDSKRFLSIILRHAERLNDIVSDLLGLARLENAESAQGLSREEIGVRDLYESTVEFCAMQARQKNIELDYQCEPDLKLSANRLLLEQAIINLVVNGIKYSDDGGKVTLASKRENGMVSLFVKDNGIGIPQEHLPRIFERFYRIDKARTREEGGSGLGLAIVKHIAIAHGGEISVESELGKGSVFALHLPTMPVHAEH